MIQTLNHRPGPAEAPEPYRRYLGRIPDNDLVSRLESQLDTTLAMIDHLDPDARYAPGKWSVAEVLVHLADTERIFATRALRIARADPTPLPGFEQDDYIAAADLDHRAYTEIQAELRAVRAATVALYRGLSDIALLRTGTAAGVPFTPRGIAWVVAGHELHHREILMERYR